MPRFRATAEGELHMPAARALHPCRAPGSAPRDAKQARAFRPAPEGVEQRKPAVEDIGRWYQKLMPIPTEVPVTPPSP
jgi:hypothetical protein